MATTVPPDETNPPKKSKLPLIIGLVLMLLGGGGAFYAVWSGMILGPQAENKSASDDTSPLPDIAFVAIDPIVIALGESANNAQLRMSSQLEVEKKYLTEVELLKPRVLDVLNSYLRAVEIRQLQDPGALIKLRAQMFRRVQIATGEGRVRNFLITEFVVN